MIQQILCKLRKLEKKAAQPGPAGPPGIPGGPGADGAPGPAGPAGPAYNFTSADLYVETFAAGSNNGTTPAWARNATLTRTAVGRWTVAFNSSHPNGTSYHINATAEEQANQRDTPDITVVQGSKTANGFQLQITTGDNGASADGYVDTPFSIAVAVPTTVIVAAVPA